MTEVKIYDGCKRFKAEEDTWQSCHAASCAAQEYHNRTGEEVQVANYDGVVYGYISADGRGYGVFATCG